MAKSARRASATSRHLELECKFAVDDATPTPSLDNLSGIGSVRREPAQTLRAVYFDTSGRDLAAHRITLRRRTGGTDAGWHLKLPAGALARTEIRVELGDGDDADVPDELRDVVQAIVRDRPLEAVARITNHRTIDTLIGSDGTALAEFCDDRVSASAEGTDIEQLWREWEIELAEDAVERGSADEHLLVRLSKQLGRSGAAPAQHASKLARTLGSSVSVPGADLGSKDPVRRALAGQIEALLIWDRAVRADVEEDSVHQMRVAIRTIRSLLQSSLASFGLTDDAGILVELGELGAVMGEARDAEVLAQRYQRALDELPEDLVRGPIRQRLVDGADRRYRAGLRKSLRAMRSPRYFRLLDTLDALLVAEPGGSAVGKTKRGAAAIEDGYKRVCKRAQAAAGADAEHHDAALHAIRKSAKRLRYTADAAGATKVARAAKTIQTVLGDHQDSVVSRAYLADQADLAHAAGEDTFTYGLLHEREAILAHRSEQQLHAALKSLDTAVVAKR